MKDKEAQKRETILSALFILTGDSEYNKQMLEDCKTSNDLYKEQKKTKTREEKWISIDEIQNKYNELLDKVKAMFLKQMIADYSVIMENLLLGFLGGASGLPPCKSKDYTKIKIKNYGTSKDDYYKNDKLVFNQYKTSKTYGEQSFDVKDKAPEFYKIISKWIKCNPSDYLLFSSKK